MSSLPSYSIPIPPHSPTNEAAQSQRLRKFPESHAEWLSWYNMHHDAYLQVQYSIAEMQGWHLFRALDSSGNIIAETRRFARDIAFVVDTDATALAGAAWSLEPQDGTEGEDNEDVERGLAVWRRSKLQQTKMRWAKTGAVLGAVALEAVRMGTEAGNYQTTLVAYDPRWVRVEYDTETGTQLQRLIVEYEYMDEGEVLDGRFIETPIVHRYLRVVDRREVSVWVDGEYQATESGPHGQSVCPAALLAFLPLPSDPCHGLWAAPGLEHSLSLVDSFFTQVQAIGNRHANPILAAMGFKLPSGGGDVYQFGRTINGVAANGEVKYLEANLTGLSALLDAAQQAHEQAKATLPEFLFTEAGANASGSALNFRAAQFVAKMEEIRGRWFDTIAELTEIAIAMDEGGTWNPDERTLKVSAPPVLPVNEAEQRDTLLALVDKRLITKRDAVVHLQRMGWIPDDRDPEEYVTELQGDMQAETDVSETGAMLRALGNGITAETVPGDEAETDEDEELPPERTA